MVADVWSTAPDVFPGVVLDAAVVMPNHLHAVLMLGTDHVERNPTLGDVMKWFKTLTTVEYAKSVALLGWPRFPGRLWQHRSYDHIVPDNADLERVRRYIEANPWRWTGDDLYVPTEIRSREADKHLVFQMSQAAERLRLRNAFPPLLTDGTGLP
jgi:REP element-mobilizing transposase RayT